MAESQCEQFKILDDWIACAIERIQQVTEELSALPQRHTTPVARRLITTAVQDLSVLLESGREAQIRAALLPETSPPLRRSFRSQGEANAAARRILERLLGQIGDGLNVAWVDSEFTMRADPEEVLTSRAARIGETWTFSFVVMEPERQQREEL